MTQYYPEDADEHDPLIGMVLKDGWTVSERIKRKAKQTGGAFSYGYVAVKGNDKAYLKAFDFEAAFQDDEPMEALETAVKSFNFEVGVLKACSDTNMKRVVRAITYGVVNNSNVPFGKLYYLLFELAEMDVRLHVTDASNADVSWCIRCLHQIAAALQGLHARGIYHQDLKPSNILNFDNGRTTKVADLGRAFCETIQAPHDDAKLPGAWRYAAPELLYGSPLANRQAQRAAADLYLFGSMIFFMIMKVPITPEVMSRLRPEHRVGIFGGSNFGVMLQGVLPYLNEAHAETISVFRSALQERLPGQPELVERIVDLLRYATAQNPAERGHPNSRRKEHGNPYDLERFVSELDLVAKRIDINFKPPHARRA